ncbi:DUF2567 domain-containing protein [Nocardia amikacinitolerans]|uniref:DUF2567 domain-containing protein n=1 Tax=Nocardia amikacinitolerans TaxID=756689 RepID=UPI00082EB959|nr:DUF2567 domain-containing protein [Nocardia amikacinitolerans]MCP2280655.1 Protein of unknown function (DUF2567) [Nocardia amikacinitolerans]MCP2319758.1 Protein of unknown function (DUF2567) [Nocardia amikacinitolerans]
MAARGVRTEAGAALLVSAAVVVCSVLVGVLWGFLAPTEQLLVTEPGRGAPLTGESTHQFDAVALFVCAGGVTGLLTAVAAWRLRTVRGPLLQLGLVSGSLLGAYSMALVGETVAELLHPRPDDPPVGQIIELPTQVGTALALVVQPLVASLVLLFLAALNPSEDLGTGYGSAFGRSRPVEAFTPIGFDAAGAGAQYGSSYGRYDPAAEGGTDSVSRPAR